MRLILTLPTPTELQKNMFMLRLLKVASGS